MNKKLLSVCFGVLSLTTIQPALAGKGGPVKSSKPGPSPSPTVSSTASPSPTVTATSSPSPTATATYTPSAQATLLPAPSNSMTQASASIVTYNADTSVGAYQALEITAGGGDSSLDIDQSADQVLISQNGMQVSAIPSASLRELRVHALSRTSVTLRSGLNMVRAYVWCNGNCSINNQSANGVTNAVTIGIYSGNSVIGNSTTQAFVNPEDSVSGVGYTAKVDSFYQPWTTSTTNVDYISKSLAGQNLRDPSDQGMFRRYTNRSLLPIDAAMLRYGINQWHWSDCYFLAPLYSMVSDGRSAGAFTGRLNSIQQRAIELGDGSYAVYLSNDANTVRKWVRVDGEFGPESYMQTPGADGAIWGTVYEKAFAFIRTGGNSYSSLNWGYNYMSLVDLGEKGYSNPGISYASAANVNNLAASLKLMAAGTPSSTAFIASHSYSVIQMLNSNTIIVRNPWGIADARPGDAIDLGDGFIQVPLSTFQSNFSGFSYSL